jgi:acyl carrier protein
MLIENATSSDEIEDWDSLNHINLVSAIEKEFKIKFALGELMTLKDVGAMVDLMVEKLK